MRCTSCNLQAGSKMAVAVCADAISCDLSSLEDGGSHCHEAAASAGHPRRAQDVGSVILGCTKATYKECMTKNLVDLRYAHRKYVDRIEKGLPIFLFNFTQRELHGIFEAADGGICEDARGLRKPLDFTSRPHFAARVRVRAREDWPIVSLRESVFKEYLTENYYTYTRFYFELNRKQTDALMGLFRRQVIAPSRGIGSKSEAVDTSNASKAGVVHKQTLDAGDDFETVSNEAFGSERYGGDTPHFGNLIFGELPSKKDSMSVERSISWSSEPVSFYHEYDDGLTHSSDESDDDYCSNTVDTSIARKQTIASLAENRKTDSQPGFECKEHIRNPLHWERVTAGDNLCRDLDLAEGSTPWSSESICLDGYESICFDPYTDECRSDDSGDIDVDSLSVREDPLVISEGNLACEDLAGGTKEQFQFQRHGVYASCSETIVVQKSKEEEKLGSDKHSMGVGRSHLWTSDRDEAYTYQSEETGGVSDREISPLSFDKCSNSFRPVADGDISDGEVSPFYRARTLVQIAEEDRAFSTYTESSEFGELEIDRDARAFPRNSKSYSYGAMLSWSFEVTRYLSNRDIRQFSPSADRRECRRFLGNLKRLNILRDDAQAYAILDQIQALKVSHEEDADLQGVLNDTESGRFETESSAQEQTLNTEEQENPDPNLGILDYSIATKLNSSRGILDPCVAMSMNENLQIYSPGLTQLSQDRIRLWRSRDEDKGLRDEFELMLAAMSVLENSRAGMIAELEIMQLEVTEFIEQVVQSLSRDAEVVSAN